MRRRVGVPTGLASVVGRRSVLIGAMGGQQFKPMGVWPAGEQFGRALADAVGLFAAAEPLVVEEESQQVQEIAAELTAEEEIGPQAAVDVLDEGTGA